MPTFRIHTSKFVPTFANKMPLSVQINCPPSKNYYLQKLKTKHNYDFKRELNYPSKYISYVDCLVRHSIQVLLLT